MGSHPYAGMSNGKIVRYGGPGKDRHRMFMGPSGSGKDTSHLLVDLLLTNETMLVFDPAAEAFAVTARSRKRRGFVKLIDPMGEVAKLARRPGFEHLAQFKSQGFDPLRQLTLPNPTLATDVAKISEVMAPMEGDAKNRFFIERTRQILDCLMMRETLFAKEANRKPSMENVMDMLTYPHVHPNERDPNVKTLQKLMISISDHPYRPMARLAPSFIPSNDQVLSVLATAISTCRSLISDEQIIADIQHGEDPEWEDGKRKLGTWYIVLPGDLFETHAIWLRLVLGDILSVLAKTSPGEQRPILKLNEVGNLGRIDALKRAIKMIRKNGVRIDTYWQSMGDVEEIYGRAGLRSFITNSGQKTTWATDDETTMDYFAKRAGTETVEMDSYRTEQSGDQKNRHAAGVNVLNPDDVSALPDCKTWNFLHGVPYVKELDTPIYTEICKGYDPNPYH